MSATFPHILESSRCRVAVYRKSDRFAIRWRGGKDSGEETRTQEADALARAQEIFAGLDDGIPFTRDDVAALQTYRKIEAMLGDKGTLLDAVRFFLDKHDSIARDVNVLNAIAEYFTAQTGRGLSDDHLNMVAYHLTRFETAVGAATILSAITVEQINTLLLTYGSPRYRDNARSTLNAFFTWAQKHRYVPATGETVAQRSDKPIVPRKDPLIFTPENFEKLLRAAESTVPQLVPYLAIGAFAGLRASEIVRLSEAAHQSVVYLDIEQGIVALGSSITKTGRRRIAKIPDNLKAWLEKFPLTCVSEPQSKISELCKSIGVAWVKNGPRKSFVSYSLAAGNSSLDLFAQCGHSMAVSANCYTALATPEQSKTWFNLYPL